MSNNKIFVSYRRQDASGEAGRLVDNLEEVFGDEAVFLDVETLEAGLDFVQAIDQALNSCKVLIAIIGPHWANIKDTEGNLRLFNDGDFIRIEIAAALERNIRVIPVLVNGAKMPSNSQLPEELKALNRRHAHELSSSRWKYDTDQLIEVLSKIIEPKKKKAPEPMPRKPTPRPQKKGWFAKNYLWVLGIFVVLIILIISSDDFQEGYQEGLAESGYTQETTPSQDFVDQGATEFSAISGYWGGFSPSGDYFSYSMVQNGTQLQFQEFDGDGKAMGNATGSWTGTAFELNYENISEQRGTVYLYQEDEITLRMVLNLTTIPDPIEIYLDRID